MKKRTLEILHRYRAHLLDREQVALRDRLADENLQKARLLQLQMRVRETHEAKGRATSASDLCSLDEAAAYLHGRMTLASRALELARSARHETMERALQLKQERDQVGHVVENGRRRFYEEKEISERLRLDDLANSRYALTREAA